MFLQGMKNENQLVCAKLLRCSLMNTWIAEAKKKEPDRCCKLKYERTLVLKPISKNGQICTGFLLIMIYK